MKNSGIKLSLLTMVLYSITLFISDARTHAGFWENLYNGYEQYSKLPEEVNQLQQSYEQTMNELNSAKQNMEAFQERNEDLIQQNEELMKQNANLNQLVSQMQQAEADRKAAQQKVINTAIVGVLLIIGYFVLIRVIRFRMRRASRH
ncbi:hypothetical protein BK126_08065 [Paenibacillus sp. FSL H7-0326]|uniref:hypothetical protein n=1 Tax=Paenibacillus sp. FSL H7-0326 TaxID=1921144 RepID=UPI00096D6227|nr:hypothetical protein [Paenibacillus sp. FSL H7-0326]OMC71968.1 hypothetical protein BK126_08065 [Paenibacillus sp. FSL H7-0326]